MAQNRTRYAPIKIVIFLRFNKMLGTSWPVEELFLSVNTFCGYCLHREDMGGSKDITPLILNLDTNLMWVVSLTLRPLRLFSRRLDGPVAGVDTDRAVKRTASFWAPSGVTLPTRASVLGIEQPAAAHRTVWTVRAGFAFRFHQLNLPRERLAPRCSVRSVERWPRGIVFGNAEGLYWLQSCWLIARRVGGRTGVGHLNTDSNLNCV